MLITDMNAHSYKEIYKPSPKAYLLIKRDILWNRLQSHVKDICAIRHFSCIKKPPLKGQEEAFHWGLSSESFLR